MKRCSMLRIHKRNVSMRTWASEGISIILTRRQATYEMVSLFRAMYSSVLRQAERANSLSLRFVGSKDDANYSCEYDRDQRPKMQDRGMNWNLCESESESYSIDRAYRLGTEQLVRTINDKQRGQNTWTLTRITGLIADTSVAKLEQTHRPFL